MILQLRVPDVIQRIVRPSGYMPEFVLNASGSGALVMDRLDQATDPHDFRDDGRALLSFADRVRVRCRRCGAPGVVLHQKAGDRAAVVFRCAACNAAGSSAERDWLGPTVVGGRRQCSFCGHAWSVAPRRLAAGARPPQHIKARCPQCARETRANASIAPGSAGSEPTDPYLGLPLLLVTQTRFGALWCYNEAHLAFLKNYVTARQRRRTAQTTHHSMFVRLPAWIKFAKNRAEILKALDRIAKLAAAPG
jgi:hypothetical protein